ncbi:MAG TPA: succinate dehydrogenase, hydrophobic membrane anchor protein [Methylophilaceae bacterium]|jgi:succinate dehydrogenase / fumarate reductase membrane anchor subunit
MVARLFTQSYTGMREWLLQRFTAVFMTAYLILIGAMLIAQRPTYYVAWQSLFSPLWLRLATLLFLLSLFLHAWLGVRDIINDYVHPLALRMLLLRLVFIALIAYAVWSVTILWSVQ